MKLLLIRRFYALLCTHDNDFRRWEPIYKYLLLKMDIDWETKAGGHLLRTFDPKSRKVWGFIMTDMSDEDLLSLFEMTARRTALMM